MLRRDGVIDPLNPVLGECPEPFDGVGRWYEDFQQTTDAEVCYLLKAAKQPPRKRVA